MNEIRKEKVVEASIGEHASDGMEVADGAVSARITFFQYDDRPDGGREHLPFIIRYNGYLPQIGRPHHDGERLFGSSQPYLQFSGGFFNAGNVESAYTPYTENISVIQKSSCLSDWVGCSYLSTVLAKELEGGTAGLAGNCLGMMTAGYGIGILVEAPFTHGKVMHRGPYTVVRKFPDDAVPGPAVDA